jgi:7,8-dihydroneopterin aldolase/epimerase/oxygenase
MDKILLNDIRLLIRVGTTPTERQTPQLCAIDLALGVDLEKPGVTGDLADSIDYVVLFRKVEHLCSGKSFNLLEEIAHQVCQEMLGIAGIQHVKLRIRKLHPFSDQLQSVGIEVKRRQTTNAGRQT